MRGSPRGVCGACRFTQLTIFLPMNGGSMSNRYSLVGFFAVIATLTTPLLAYEEWSIPGLNAPNALEPVAIEATYQHQFQGSVFGRDRPGNLFGIGDGADARIGIRSTLWKTAQLYVSYDSRQMVIQSHNEFTAGTGYAVSFPRLHFHLQAEAEIFSYASFLTFPEERKTGGFIDGSLRSDPLFERVTLLAILGYRFSAPAPGAGLGCTVTLTDMVGVYGAWFALWDRSAEPSLQVQGPTSLHNPWLFGVKLTTYGHQFLLYAGNTVENGPRHLMQGTVDNKLRLGFIIKRLFSFSKYTS
jgi:hypothetical protein